MLDFDMTLGVGPEAARAAAAARGKRPHWRIDDAHLERVAEVWRAADDAGRPTRRAIATEFGVSPHTAKKWIGRARGKGLLGKRAGEEPTTEGDD
jgi:hypothetical protein